MRAGLILGAGLVGLAGVAWWLAQRQAPPEVEQGDPLQWFNLDNITEEITTMGNTQTTGPQADNVAAFLMAIRHAEGTAGPEGYRTMFGGRLFDGWADHPRIAHQFTDRAGRRLWTSAAGAYQFMAVSVIPGGGATRVNTWDRLKAKLGLLDFTPASQDRAALELIDEAGALQDVKEGRFVAAVGKVRRIWASMPGAGYSQGERSIEWLTARYNAAGGVVA